MSGDRHDPVREFLMSASRAHVEVCTLRRRIERLTSQIERITPAYSLVPGAGGTDRDSAIVALADMRCEYEAKLIKAELTEAKVAEFVDSVPGEENREVLYLRYCEGLSWPSVLLAMQADRCCYSERQMYRIHGRALNEARIKWEENEHEVKD
jgi:hypothetical protein